MGVLCMGSLTKKSSLHIFCPLLQLCQQQKSRDLWLKLKTYEFMKQIMYRSVFYLSWKGNHPMGHRQGGWIVLYH